MFTGTCNSRHAHWAVHTTHAQWATKRATRGHAVRAEGACEENATTPIGGATMQRRCRGSRNAEKDIMTN